MFLGGRSIGEGIKSGRLRASIMPESNNDRVLYICYANLHPEMLQRSETR